MSHKDDVFDALTPLEAAGLANPPAKLVEFFGLAARMLSQYPIEAIRNGVEDVILTSEFFPRIAALAEAVKRANLRGESRIQQNAEKHHMRPEIIRQRATQELADKNPVDWTAADHADFERWYGKPVWWKGEPHDTEMWDGLTGEVMASEVTIT